MTVGAEQLPVAAARRVVVVVAVFVMHFQQLKIGVREGARTAATHPRLQFERLRAIALGTLVGVAPGVADDFVQPVVRLRHGGLLRAIQAVSLRRKPRRGNSSHKKQSPAI
jgi:hypothetical protein